MTGCARPLPMNLQNRVHNFWYVALFLLLGPVFASAADEAPELPPSPVPNNYIIGPGDELQIFVWRNPDLSTKVPVRPDGKISTPLVEDMIAVGKNPSQLARDME